jgi:hypothetical protein
MIPKICPSPTSSSRTRLKELAEAVEVVKVPKEVAIALNLLAEVEEVVNPIAKEDVQDSGLMNSNTKKAVKINKMFSRPREQVT